MLKVGSTIELAIAIKNTSDVLTDPATSVKVTVKGPTKTVKVDEQGMTNDAVGKYSYSYTINDGAGTYYVTYTALDGTEPSIEEDTFGAEEPY